MSLATRVADLATRTAEEFKALRGLINGKFGFMLRARTASIPTANTTTTWVPFTGASTEGDTPVDWTFATSSPYGATCQRSGVWLVNFAGLWIANATGNRRLVVTLDGVALPERAFSSPNAAVLLGQQVLISRRFTAGQVLAFGAYQASGGPLDFDAATVTFTRIGD